MRLGRTSALVAIPLILLMFVTAVYAFIREEPCGKLIIGSDRTVQPVLDKVVEILEKRIEERKGCRIRVVRDYGPTGIVWFKLSTSSVFDVYGTISGQSFRQALDSGLLDRSKIVVLGYADLLIYLREGNPYEIEGLRDLALHKSGLTIAIPHPDYTATGQIARAICEEIVDEASGKTFWELIHERHKVVYVFTASKAVAYVRMGSADVGITFRTYYVVNPKGVSVVEIEKELNRYVQPMIVAITKYMSNEELANELMEILKSDEIKKQVEKLGYIPPEKLSELAPYAKVYKGIDLESR
ncbi:MAG: substrate-binding domain-containing protein [Acidilobaceae archaeon]